MPYAPSSARPLRAVTFNIHHGRGLDGRLDLGRVAAVVEATASDVVGLQEVDRHFGPRSGFADQAAWLAERLGMHAAYGANVHLEPPSPGSPRRQYGTALLSPFPLRDTRNTPLPRPRGGEPRGLLEAVVDVDGSPVRAFVTHLENSSPAERLAQAEAVRARVTAAGPEPVVLLGDLNARPGSPEVAVLTRDLADVWATAGDGPGFTFDAATPHTRIDYVLSSPTLVARNAAVVPTDASDHRPVVADLLPDLPLAESPGAAPPGAGG